MHYLSVPNWANLQHYKDRDPTWIKLHRTLLSNYEWAQLPDASKAHLIGLWLVAARTDNRIPADPAWLARQIGATDAVDLEPLLAGGWVAWIEPASDALATCYQPASDALAGAAAGQDPPAQAGTDGEQSPGASDALATCYQPASDALALTHSREKRREEKRREEESLTTPSRAGAQTPADAREARPSFSSFSDEQRAQVTALAKKRAAMRAERGLT